MGENPFLRALKDELAEREVLFAEDLTFVGLSVPISFPAQKLAVFVDPCADGCGCPEHYLGMIETDKDEPYNAPFGPEPTRCSARIEQENHRLADAGWKVMRFWEHDVDRSPDEVARKIYDELDRA
jgi:DNA mismatch endonuclease (patch repair protein)